MTPEQIEANLQALKIKYEQLRVKFNTHRDNKEIHKEMI